MSRATITIDDDACAEIMRRYRLRTKRAAVNMALQSLSDAPKYSDKAIGIPVDLRWELPDPMDYVQSPDRMHDVRSPNRPPRNYDKGRTMSRTTVDVDDDACTEIMRRYRLRTKQAAVNLALATLAGDPMSLEEARALRGTGWDGDLDRMRTTRFPDW